MIEQTVPGSFEDLKLQREEKNGRAVKLDPAEKSRDQEKDKLKQRDQEVKRHEGAHLAAAGGHARGGASFSYQVGEDGKNYAVGGHVSIDTSKEDTPEATIIKMQQIIAAAKAPADPSSQDLKVASQAALTMQEARKELAEKNREEKDGKSPNSIKVETAYKGSSMKSTFSVEA